MTRNHLSIKMKNIKPFRVNSFSLVTSWEVQVHLDGNGRSRAGSAAQGGTEWQSKSRDEESRLHTHRIQGWDAYLGLGTKKVCQFHSMLQGNPGRGASAPPPPLLRPKSFGNKANTPEQT